MSQEPHPMKVAFGCLVMGVLVVGALVVFSLMLDSFDHATRGSVVEWVLNGLSTAWYWGALVLVGVVVCVSLLTRNKADSGGQ